MRVVTYSRVSTAEQVSEGLSLEAQQARMQSWAQATGAIVIESVVDAGVSGTKPLVSRPGGARIAALMKAKTPGIDAVVVVRLDRLGRDAAESLALFKRFRTGRVGLVSIADQVDLASAHGRAMAGIGAIFAELERALIAQRTTDALGELRRQGRAWNHPPLGWSVVDGRLVPIKSEQRTLRRMRSLRGKGASYRKVAQDLTDKGHATKTGGSWAAATVRSALLAQVGIPDRAQAPHADPVCVP